MSRIDTGRAGTVIFWARAVLTRLNPQKILQKYWLFASDVGEGALWRINERFVPSGGRRKRIVDTFPKIFFHRMHFRVIDGVSSVTAERTRGSAVPRPRASSQTARSAEAANSTPSMKS